MVRGAQQWELWPTYVFLSALQPKRTLARNYATKLQLLPFRSKVSKKASGSILSKVSNGMYRWHVLGLKDPDVHFVLIKYPPLLYFSLIRLRSVVRMVRLVFKRLLTDSMLIILRETRMGKSFWRQKDFG